MTIEFTCLADRQDAIPMIAKWYFEEWGRLRVGDTLEQSTERLNDYLNKDKIPFILLAIENSGIAGVAQLKYREMATMFPEKEHWLGGVFVAPDCRGRGIGSLIANEIAIRSASHGVHTLYLQTESLHGGLYAKLGWQAIEQVNNHGLEVLVMERQIGDQQAE